MRPQLDALKNFFKNNRLLIILLAVIFIKEILFIIVVPLWQNNDEIEHFAYTQFIVEEGKLPIPRTGGHLDLTQSPELAAANLLLESDRVSFAVFKKNQIIHQDFSDPSSPRDTGVALIGLSRKYPNQDQLQSPAAIYPPLYYLLESVPYSIFRDDTIIARSYAMRLFNIALYLPVIVLSYLIALRVGADTKLALATAALVGFLPRFTFTSAGINNDIFVILVSSLTIYLLLRYWEHSLNWVQASWLGLVVGLGLLSKPQYLIFIIFLILLFTQQLAISKKRILTVAKFLLVAAIAITIASGWLAFTLETRNSNPVHEVQSLLQLNSSSSNSQASMPLADTLNYVLFRYLFLILSSFSLLGCCHEISLSAPLTAFFLLGMALGFFGFLLHLAGMIKKEKLLRVLKSKTFLVALFPIILELAYLAIFIRQPLAQGFVDFPIDGRYLFPMIAPTTILIMLGLKKITPQKIQRPMFAGVVLLAALLNVGILIFSLLPRYYL